MDALLLNNITNNNYCCTVIQRIGAVGKEEQPLFFWSVCACHMEESLQQGNRVIRKG